MVYNFIIWPCLSLLQPYLTYNNMGRPGAWATACLPGPYSGRNNSFNYNLFRIFPHREVYPQSDERRRCDRYMTIITHYSTSSTQTVTSQKVREKILPQGVGSEVSHTGAFMRFPHPHARTF